MTYLDELTSQIDTMQSSLDAEKSVMQSILNRSKSGGTLAVADSRIFDQAERNATGCEARLSELRRDQSRTLNAEPVETYLSRHGGSKDLTNGVGGARVITEGGPYRADGAHSYFRDLWAGRFRSDTAALDRLQRNDKHVATYSRAALTTVNGTGGEFVPPLWLEDQFVAYARPARPTADLCTNEDLPGGTDSINIPKIATGSAVAYQGTQNTLINETDLTTSSITSGVYTVAGGQTFSIQLFDQSPVSGRFDKVIMQDLSADLARFIDANTVLMGSGTGQPVGLLNLAAATQLTWTTGSPTPGGFVSAVADAALKVQTLRFMPATAIVMHPRRWAWLISQVDSTGRPLIPPGIGTMNQNSYGSQIDGQPAQGHVGSLLGYPVAVDASIPTNLGTGTNQDVVIVAKFDDVFLWQGRLQADIFPQTFASTGSLYARLYQYVSFQAGRYPAAISVIGGTGLVAPSFAA
jgi:HK97 family phage major capsid protein